MTTICFVCQHGIGASFFARSVFTSYLEDCYPALLRRITITNTGVHSFSEDKEEITQKLSEADYVLQCVLGIEKMIAAYHPTGNVLYLPPSETAARQTVFRSLVEEVINSLQ